MTGPDARMVFAALPGPGPRRTAPPHPHAVPTLDELLDDRVEAAFEPAPADADGDVTLYATGAELRRPQRENEHG